jgi:hypothetical protein
VRPADAEDLRTWVQSNCTLFTAKSSSHADTFALSGMSGFWTSANWTTHPQHFYLNGYFTLGPRRVPRSHPRRSRRADAAWLPRPGSGKIFHTEEGGIGPDPWYLRALHPHQPLGTPRHQWFRPPTSHRDGEGMPPNQDPPSWSPGQSMQEVNAVAPMWGCDDTNTNG